MEANLHSSQVRVFLLKTHIRALEAVRPLLCSPNVGLRVKLGLRAGARCSQYPNWKAHMGRDV